MDVLIPPPQEAEEAPININIEIITIEEIDMLEISTVLNPAVLEVTDWNKEANILVPKSNSFMLWLNSRKKIKKNPAIIKIGVNDKTILEWREKLCHDNFFLNWFV